MGGKNKISIAMGYAHDQIDKNKMQNYFNILKINRGMYKTFYIGLVDNNDPDEGYNIINKNWYELLLGRLRNCKKNKIITVCENVTR